MPMLSSFGGGSLRGFKNVISSLFNFTSYTFGTGGAVGRFGPTFDTLRPSLNTVDLKTYAPNLGTTGGYGQTSGMQHYFTVSKEIKVSKFWFTYYEYSGTPSFSVTIYNDTQNTIITSGNWISGHGQTTVSWIGIPFTEVTFFPGVFYRVQVSVSGAYAQNTTSISSTFNYFGTIITRYNASNTDVSWGFSATLPSLADIPSWILDDKFFTTGTYQGQQLFTIPSTGFYSFTVAGAKGGDGSSSVGGSGRIVNVVANLTAGQKIRISVGQKGSTFVRGFSTTSGGGGGTFVTTINNDIIAIAGGGGGAHYSSSFGGAISGHHAPTSNYGTTQTGGIKTSDLGLGGTNSGDPSYGGGGGGGFNGNGQSGSDSIRGGNSYFNGLIGGPGYTYTTGPNSAEGGFGGGGGGWVNSETRPGGGGGYSGGDGSTFSNPNAGGGGGSHLGNYNIVSSSYGGLNAGDGYVTITKL